MTVVAKRFQELTTDELYRLLKARVDVFVVEQQCPYPELDDRDQAAVHVWLEESGELFAYLRVMDRGVESEFASIGRVLTLRRRQGLGSRVLSEGIRVAAEVFGADTIYLEAQTYARPFYEKLGFRQASDPFPIDGIPHIRMLRDGTRGSDGGAD